MQSKRSSLILRDLALNVHLGVTPEERELLQQVMVNVEFRFSTLPHGCCSDDLRETINYAEVVQQLVDLCANKEFNLIEHLCHEIHLFVQEVARKNSAVASTSITKKPPLANLGASCFVINDIP